MHDAKREQLHKHHSEQIGMPENPQRSDGVTLNPPTKRARAVEPYGSMGSV